MKKYLVWIPLSIATLCFYAISGEAAVFISTIDFPASTTATDTQSGNSIDYIYEHDLSELDVPDTTIHSAALELKHLGNQDLGPTAEIWYVLSGNGTFMGRLGESNSRERTDHFELSQTLLDEITAGDPWKLKMGFSEQTSFNGEKLTLLRSQLQIDYTRSPVSQKGIPQTPEPSAFILLTCGLLAAISRRYSK